MPMSGDLAEPERTVVEHPQRFGPSLMVPRYAVPAVLENGQSDNGLGRRGAAAREEANGVEVAVMRHRGRQNAGLVVIPHTHDVSRGVREHVQCELSTLNQ